MAGRAGRGFGWGFGCPMYNPSQPKLNQFRSLLEGLISSPSSTIVLPFLSTKIPLGARVVFRLRRPNVHFVNSRRERGLRASAPKKFVVEKADLDNLVKFVLNAMGGVAFADDQQISQLTCKKVWDVGDGSTTCTLTELEE
jgi:Holliday junction resolvase RusA-like endonuclease